MENQAIHAQENERQPADQEVSQLLSTGEQGGGFTDNRPEAIVQRQMQEAANNSPQALQLKAVQEAANNSPQSKEAAQLKAMAASHSAQQQSGGEPIQRALAMNASATGHNRVEVNDYRPWVGGLATAMPVGSTQDRCHVISFEQIRLGVWQALVAFMYGSDTFTDFSNAISRLRSAVFPNGGTAGTHGTTALNSIASTLYAQIASDVAAIGSASGSSAEATRISLADRIVLSMNSSPDNLRPADKTTNQSIGQALDPRGGDVSKMSHSTLGDIFVISGTTAQQLLALSQDDRRRLIEVYMDKHHIQNSESAGETVSSLKGGSRKIYINNGSSLISLH